MGESHENLDMGFQQGNESILNCHSSGLSTNSQAQQVAGMAMSSLTMARPSDGHGPDPFIGSWDPLGSLSQTHSEFASSSYSVTLGNQGINNASHLVQYGTSDSSFAELVPKIPGFGRGNFSEMVGSFGLPGCSELANTGYRSQYNPNKELGFESSSVHRMQSQDQRLARKEEIIRSASYGNKRKREPEPNSSSSPNKNTEGEQLKDTGKSSNRKEQEEKSRIEQQSTSDLRGKQTAKQDKDDSHSGEAPKENFVHVRARRGQATNSHSLAERVRREKISERMRLLQELVPGCNKITGKAVMLDEIINYVQSLQQQVEFLSMKLATVNPEMNFDIERIFSKDILHSRMGNSGILGLGTGMNYSLPFPQPSFPGTHPSIPSTIAQFPLPPTMTDQDFQSMLQMGYDSAAAIDNLGPNGRLKSEL